MTVPVVTGSPFVSNTTTLTEVLVPFKPVTLFTIIRPTLAADTFNITLVLFTTAPLVYTALTLYSPALNGIITLTLATPSTTGAI